VADSTVDGAVMAGSTSETEVNGAEAPTGQGAFDRDRRAEPITRAILVESS
jgi:hypothetical protein